MIKKLDSGYVMTGFLGDGQNCTDTPDEMAIYFTE